MSANHQATPSTKNPNQSLVFNQPPTVLSALLAQGVRDGVFRKAPRSARVMDSLARVFDEQASRAAKIATVARLEDAAALVSLAASDAPAYLRKDALQRLDGLMDGEPLGTADLERLVPCLRERELVAFAVVLMEIADFDWCARCDEKAVDALCLALHECRCLHESVLLEDAFACLVNARPDLGRNLRACSPGSAHLKAMYRPLVVKSMVYIDMTREDNVA